MKPERIKRFFPEIGEIKDESLKEKVVRIWRLAIERGGWKRIEDIPFTLLIPTKTTLLEHTRRVTRMALSIAGVRKDVKRDILIAGGLCHDVGKLLEYEKKGRRFVKRKSELLRHPISGALLAYEVGLPLEVVHIIATHSKEGEGTKRSKEAIIIHHCDFIDFEMES